MPSPDITCHLYTPASPRSPPALRPTTLPPALPPSACAQHPHIHALTSAVDVVDAAAAGVSDAGRCARTCTRTWREWGEREVVASGRGGCEREVEVEGEGRDECFLGGRERGPQRRRKGERNDVGVDSSVGSSVGGGNGGKEVGRELARGRTRPSTAEAGTGTGVGGDFDDRGEGAWPSARGAAAPARSAGHRPHVNRKLSQLSRVLEFTLGS